MQAESSDMPVQDKDGRWWTDDRQYYAEGDNWVLYEEPSSSSAASQGQLSSQPASYTVSYTGTQQGQSSSQPAPYTVSNTGNTLGAMSASNVADALSAFPQSSTASYQQQPQLVFGINRQTPGRAAVPRITLDSNFEDAAQRNMMIWGFTASMYNMANGKV